MQLQPSDFDQAVRYIQSALKLLDRESFSISLATRDLFDRIVWQLSPGDYFVGVIGHRRRRFAAERDSREREGVPAEPPYRTAQGGGCVEGSKLMHGASNDETRS
jgi:hypothetical protein